MINKLENPRIDAIDVLRGFALLGILLMNMMSFAMHDAAYYNPMVAGGDGINRLVYGLTHIIADQKMMGLFSMLFGASVMLYTGSLERKGRRVAPRYFFRNFWLLLFGLAHSIFLWSGDVLTIYALCSVPLFFIRKLNPRNLLILGLVIFFLPSAGQIYAQSELHELDARSHRSIEMIWRPGPISIQEDSAFYQGVYGDQVAARWADETDYSNENVGATLYYLILFGDYILRALGMMVVGIGLFKMGVLSAEKSPAFYKRMAIIGLGGGYTLAALGLGYNEMMDWYWADSAFAGRLLNNLATPLVSCGYVGLVMGWAIRVEKGDFGRTLQVRLSAVGRTAFTCYIGQSLLATYIFYGYGLGLYGGVNRLTQLLIIFVIWGIQLLLAPLWLSFFKYGPLEYIWRCLTELKLQPFLRTR